MTAISMNRMVVPLMAAVAACGIALVFAIPHFRREPPAEPKAATAVPTASKPALEARDQGPGRAWERERNLRSMLPSSSRQVKLSSRAGRRRAQRWSCYEMASCMIARSWIDPDNSSWSRPDFPQALTS